MIRSGRLKEGERLLSQRELADSLNVSRATLREALLLLENIGFITIEPGSGTFVSRKLPSSENEEVPWRQIKEYPLQSVFQTRLFLEREMVSLLAISVNSKIVAELKMLTDQMEASWNKMEIVSHIEADIAFHECIANNCPNQMLASLYRHFKDQMWETQRQPVLRAESEEMRISIIGHRTLIDALQAGNPAAARESMKEHILYTAECAGLSKEQLL